MIRLNDDCLIEIVNMLNPAGQIAMLQVCQRFKNVVRDIWKNKYKHLSLDFHFKWEMFREDEMLVLFANICDIVEGVFIDHFPANVFDIMMQYTFPKVKNLCFEALSLNDSDVIALNKMFPRLQTLRAMGNFSGKYFYLWNKLEYLQLSGCYKLKFAYLEEILRIRPLKTLILNNFKNVSDGHIPKNCQLERIRMNSSELKLLLNEEFQHLEKLQVLEVTDECNLQNIFALHSQIHSYKAKDVIAVETRNIHNILPAMVNMNFHKNLKTLTFVNDPIAFEGMLSYLQSFPALRELKFYSCRIRTQSQLLKLLSESLDLDVICIDRCGIALPKLKINVGNIVRLRRKPLVLNFSRNFWDRFGTCDEVSLEFDGSSELLSLTKEKTNPSFRNFLTFVFQKPLSNCIEKRRSSL